MTFLREFYTFTLLDQNRDYHVPEYTKIYGSRILYVQMTPRIVSRFSDMIHSPLKVIQQNWVLMIDTISEEITTSTSKLSNGRFLGRFAHGSLPYSTWTTNCKYKIVCRVLLCLCLHNRIVQGPGGGELQASTIQALAGHFCIPAVLLASDIV